MGKKVLLADDSATIQKLVEMALSDSDFELRSVSDGKEAIEQLADFQPDIILADAIMPHMDGYEVCRVVKNDERFKHVPVILLTGRFQPFDQDRAKEASIDERVVKPFSQEQLVQTIEQLLATAAPSQTEAPAESDLEETVSVSDMAEFDDMVTSSAEDDLYTKDTVHIDSEPEPDLTATSNDTVQYSQDMLDAMARSADDEEVEEDIPSISDFELEEDSDSDAELTMVEIDDDSDDDDPEADVTMELTSEHLADIEDLDEDELIEEEPDLAVEADTADDEIVFEDSDPDLSEPELGEPDVEEQDDPVFESEAPTVTAMVDPEGIDGDGDLDQVEALPPEDDIEDLPSTDQIDVDDDEDEETLDLTEEAQTLAEEPLEVEFEEIDPPLLDEDPEEITPLDDAASFEEEPITTLDDSLPEVEELPEFDTDEVVGAESSAIDTEPIEPDFPEPSFDTGPIDDDDLSDDLVLSEEPIDLDASGGDLEPLDPEDISEPVADLEDEPLLVDEDVDISGEALDTEPIPQPLDVTETQPEEDLEEEPFPVEAVSIPASEIPTEELDTPILEELEDDLANADADSDDSILEAPSDPEPAAPVAESASVPVSPSLSESQLDVLADKVADRLLSKLSRGSVEEVVWEIVPELAEAMIKKRIYQLEQAVDEE